MILLSVVTQLDNSPVLFNITSRKCTPTFSPANDEPPVQGRYDVVCPMMSAWDLHRAWPEAGFRVSILFRILSSAKVPLLGLLAVADSFANLFRFLNFTSCFATQFCMKRQMIAVLCSCSSIIGLQLVTSAGHSANEPGITSELVSACELHKALSHKDF